VKKIPVMLLLIAFSGLMLFLGFNSLSKAVKGSVAWEDVDFSKDVDGLYVTGTVYFIYDNYCEATKGSNIQSEEYIIDADDTYYMGLMAKNSSDIKNANRLMNACWTYLDMEYPSDEVIEAVYDNQYEISGTIKRIKGDHLKYYYDSIGYYQLSAEERAQFLPYYIEVGSVGELSNTGMYITLIVGGLLMLLGIGIGVYALRGGFLRNIKKYIANSSNPDLTSQRVESFLSKTDLKDGMFYDDTYIVGMDGSTVGFGETDKIAWVYPKTITHKRNFITVGHTYSVVVGFADGKAMNCIVKNEALQSRHVSMIEQKCPKAIAGYNDELNRLFHKNLSQFLSFRYNNPEYAANQDAFSDTEGNY